MLHLYLCGMKQIVNIIIPKDWQELNDKQLRFVYRLLGSNYSLPQVKTKCLIKWSGIEVIRREGALFVIRYNKQVFPISALQIAEAIQHMDWLGDFPQHPVRLSRIGFHRAVRADLQGVSFEDFIALDNLYQGFLQTRNEDLLHEMACILYKARSIKLNQEEATSIFYWFTSMKRYFANLFTHFFSKPSDGSGTSLTFAQLQENMNTQIRALTGGDITKERDVLRMDCWRALTELDAKARDYEEMQKHTTK